MLYRAILLSSVLLTLSLTTGFSSSAIAQTDGDAKPVSQHVDTAAMYSISIEDLEMIMPDKRLQPDAEKRRIWRKIRVEFERCERCVGNADAIDQAAKDVCTAIGHANGEPRQGLVARALSVRFNMQ